MPNPKNVHIVQRDDQWGALREGASRTSANYDTQAEAIQAGRDMARAGKGELFVHREGGGIRARNSYGHDPFPPKG